MAYKNLEVRKKETAQYLKVKKEEAENRRIMSQIQMSSLKSPSRSGTKT
jgi:hypothetical protein